MMKESKVLKIAATSMIAAGLSMKMVHADEINMKYAKKEPVKEEIIMKINNEIRDEFGKDMVKNMEKIEFSIPIPSTKTATEEYALKGDQNYAKREIRVNQTIQYYNFKITLYSFSYTFKEISATLIITTGEDEWKEKLKLKEEKFVDYIDHDNEKVWRLKIKLDQVKGEEGKVVINLMRKAISPDQIGKP
jgi:hypothetical protein